MKLTDKQIEALEAKGFSRWTIGTMDRMYINGTKIGLALDYYKTGNIHHAELNGEHISNCRAYSVKAAKNYIDVADGTAHSTVPELLVNLETILEEIGRC